MEKKEDILAGLAAIIVFGFVLSIPVGFTAVLWALAWHLISCP